MTPASLVAGEQRATHEACSVAYSAILVSKCIDNATLLFSIF